jgi:predicted metal-dependent phosphotriesterase family hydrolase
MRVSEQHMDWLETSTIPNLKEQGIITSAFSNMSSLNW